MATTLPTNRWKLGLFMTLGFLGMLLTLGWLGATRFERDSTESHYFFDQEVNGLELGSPIKFRGVTIGKVAVIRAAPDQRHVEVVGEIYSDSLVALGLPQDARGPEDGPFVPDDLRVELITSLLTGAAFIQGDFFDPETYPIPEYPFNVPWNTVHVVPSTYKSLEEAFRVVSERIPELTEELKHVLLGIEDTLRDFDSGELSRQAHSLLVTAENFLLHIDELSIMREGGGDARAASGYPRRDRGTRARGAERAGSPDSSRRSPGCARGASRRRHREQPDSRDRGGDPRGGCGAWCDGRGGHHARDPPAGRPRRAACYAVRHSRPRRDARTRSRFPATRQGRVLYSRVGSMTTPTALIRKSSLVAGLLVLPLWSCVSPSSAPSRRFYDVVVDTPSEAEFVGYALGHMTVAPHLRGQSIAWRLSEVELAFDEDHRWVASPIELVQQAMSPNGFTPPTVGSAPRMDVHLLAFEGVLDEPARVRVALHAHLGWGAGSLTLVRSRSSARRPDGRGPRARGRRRVDDGAEGCCRVGCRAPTRGLIGALAIGRYSQRKKRSASRNGTTVQIASTPSSGTIAPSPDPSSMVARSASITAVRGSSFRIGWMTAGKRS